MPEREEKFTPGPWIGCKINEKELWVCGKYLLIAHVQGSEENEGGANAVLIAAATEMYDALGEALDAIDNQLLMYGYNMEDRDFKSLDKARDIIESALKKARGEE